MPRPIGLAPLFLLALVLAQGASANPIEQRYGLAAAGFHRLNKTENAQPAQWRRVAADFAAIHRAAPQHARGADALYSAALSQLASFRTGGGPAALAGALEDFERFVTVYPAHRLADDSLMQVGALRAEEFGDQQRAYLAYRRVLNDYPNGDQAPLARKHVAALKNARPPPRAVAYGVSSRKKAPRAVSGKISSRAASRKVSSRAVSRKGRSGSVGAAQTRRPPPVATAARAGAEAVGVRAGDAVPAATIKRLRFWSARDWTRVILTLDDVVDFESHRLPGRKGVPPRLYLDLKNTRPQPGLRREHEVGDAVVDKIRIRRNTEQNTRVVFDLKGMERFTVREFRLPQEKKIVIDLFPRKAGISPRAAVPGAGPANKGATATGRVARAGGVARPSLQAALGLKVGTVVIDPGHGGRDPGAVAFGMQEKHLALKIAKALRAVFRKNRPDLRVELTRTGDTFIPLEKRPEIAKSIGADLFISIHLNAHRQERFSGVETYFLNLTSDASALRVAARENSTTQKQVGDLNAILRDLLRDTNILESSRLANSLQATLIAELRSDWPVRDLGVKQAPFMVLIGAEMPSVLVEAGFLTNRRESRRLRSGRYLTRIAEGIYEGLRKYIREQAVALQRPESLRAAPGRDG